MNHKIGFLFHRKHWFLGILLLTNLLSLGCALQKVYMVPTWIFQPPKDKDFIYVVGSAGQSISPWESKEMAIQDGYVKLAQIVGTNVSARILQRTMGSHKWSSSSILKTSTKTALKEARWVAFWADPEGKAGMGYRVFVLMKLNKKFIPGLE